MAFVESIKNLGAVNVVMILGIIVIVVLLLTNYCQVNQTEKRDKTVQDNLKIEKLDESISSQKAVPAAAVTPRTTVRLYYTEWCGYSTMFKPNWELIKQRIGASDIKNIVAFEQYDCDKNSGACGKINGYPTITFQTVNGSETNYEGDRSVDAMVNFITEKTKTV